MSDLSEADLKTIDDCQCYNDWYAACQTIKERHDGHYPDDWHAVVLQGGLGNRVLARWGMDLSFKSVSVGPGQSIEEARKALTRETHAPVQCKGCGRFPDQIGEYVEMAAGEPKKYKTPTAAAKTDGTYNRGTGKFYCTTCYIAADQPKGTA